MYITRTSIISNIERTLDINVTDEQLKDWQSGTNIQTAMPHLSKSDREFLKTGIVDNEWDAAFKDEDEEQEDENESLFVDHETDDYIG